MKVGVVLIGGSLQGIYAHTGVMSAIHDTGIKPSVILGASAGSIVGSLYCVDKDIREMYRMMSTLKAEDYIDLMTRWEMAYEFIWNKTRGFSGFAKGNQLEKYMRQHLGEKDDFLKCSIPFYVAAFQIKSRELKLFSTGKISEKVRASTAIPMMFQPKKIDGEYYFDGALRKYDLTNALHDIRPDLDVILVSHIRSEMQTGKNMFMPDSRFPIFDITKVALEIKDYPRWKHKIGETKIIHVHPPVRTPVNIFKPDKYLARAVYHEAKTYSKYHLRKELEKLNG